MKASISKLFIFLSLLFLVTSCSDNSATDPDNNTQRPEPRGGAPAVWVPGQQSMFFFGGMSPITNDTWQYSATQEGWSEIIDDSNIPAPRCHHTLVSNSEGTNILMFGGFSFETRFNDTWLFDAVNGEWNELNVQGSLPAARCLQASAYIEPADQMFIHGGIAGGGVSTGDFFADTWVFDLNSRTWQEINTDNSPGKLSGAISFYSTDHNAVFLWGGKQVSDYPTELWKFDLNDMTWSTVQTNGPVPGGREDPTHFWNDEEQVLYMTHGSNENISGIHPRDAFVLDLSTFTWEELENHEIPTTRWRASLVFDPETDTGYMFGGWSGFNQGNFDDLWKFDFQTREWTQVEEGS